jgi:rhodanese-related sulfurtransferase
MSFSNIYTVLLIASVVFLFTSCQDTTSAYEYTPEEVLSQLDIDRDVLSGEELKDFQKSNKDNYTLVDLSTPSSFRLDHEEGAFNIPLTLLLEEEHIELLNSEEVILLTGLPFAQSAGALVLLKSLGYDQVKVVSENLSSPEAAQYDFAATFKTTKEKYEAEVEAGKPKPVVVEVPAKKKSITPKPKKKAVVEEEEGC